MTSLRPIRPDAAAPIALEKVAMSYGAVRALDDLDLRLAPGQVTALLGPNGAGKTTAIKLMLGLLRPDSGTVRLFGGDPTERRQRVRAGAMMQQSALPDTLRVAELVQLFRSYYPRPLPQAEVLELAGLQDVAKRLYGELSGGQQRRVAFALAVCGDPELLFLDEPTVGLDVETRRALWERVRELIGGGKTVVLTTHYLEEADALADRIVVLHRGRVRADGTAYQIKSRVADRRIRCVSALHPQDVEAVSGVHSVRYDKAALEILTADATGVLRELLALDPALRDLEVTGAGIEDAFLALIDDEPPQSEDAAVA